LKTVHQGRKRRWPWLLILISIHILIVKGQQELSEGEDGARYTAEARVPTAEAAMNTPFDCDFNSHFD